jgi:CheY-like chemotaxis protein
MTYVSPDKLLNNRKVLIAVEGKLIRELMVTTLKQAGAKAILCGSGVEMLRQVQGFAPDIIFSEYELGTVTGADFIRRVRVDYKIKAPAVVLVPSEDTTAAAKSKSAGANAVIVIPFSVRDILTVTKTLIEQGPDAPTVKLRFGPR